MPILLLAGQLHHAVSHPFDGLAGAEAVVLVKLGSHDCQYQRGTSRPLESPLPVSSALFSGSQHQGHTHDERKGKVVAQILFGMERRALELSKERERQSKDQSRADAAET